MINSNKAELGQKNWKLQSVSEKDYTELASWITSASDCLHWAGPAIPFPHSSSILKDALTTEGTISHSYKNRDMDFIGFGQLWSRSGRSSHLGRIIVNPRFRNKGYGKELLRSLIMEAAHTFDHEYITLKVYRRNVQALKMYESFGFEEDSSESNEELSLMKRPANQALLQK